MSDASKRLRDFWCTCDINKRSNDPVPCSPCKAANELERLERVNAALVEAAAELIEVADLRGDAELPHPCDDEKLWTARMQTAWDDLRALATPEQAGAYCDVCERENRTGVETEISPDGLTLSVCDGCRREDPTAYCGICNCYGHTADESHELPEEPKP